MSAKSMPGITADPELERSSANLQSFSASNSKAVVVGLYGVPGSGKTFLLDKLRKELRLDKLRKELRRDDFAFYEGSQVIAAVTPGGLDGFQKLEEREKTHWRQAAIDAIGKKSVRDNKVAVVAGHFMFWSEEEEAGRPVYTQNDLQTFTHILYLDVPGEVIAQRRLDDTERCRPAMSAAHLCKWQQAEIAQLRLLCRDHGILFSVISQHPTLLNKVSMLLRDFRHHTEIYNRVYAKRRLDEVLAADKSQLETVLVMDADRTLTAEDTGRMFWKKVPSFRRPRSEDFLLKALFGGPLGYSYIAFRQATLLYEEAADDEEFDDICEEVASAVTMHPEFVSLLQLVAGQEHVRAVIVSCGLRRVWEKVLEREGLSTTVEVIGGGRIADGFVVTPEVKAALVARLKETHQMYVWAFGDSPLDLPMLSNADQAIVVVGDEQTRSKSMNAPLMNAIDNGGLRARQAVLPSNSSPRLDTTRLPLIQLTGHEFIDSVLCRRHALIQVHHATDGNAAKLLMTPMRDAKVSGPVLREAHRRVGFYLATQFLADVVGVEEYSIPHVQGHRTSGFRLLHELQTSIVALMRGGEPMALGVSDAFPLAMFVHANSPKDVKLHHLQGQRTVVLVDSVVNNGKTVVQFVQHILSLHPTIRIVVVTGVAQAQAVSGGSSLAQALPRRAELTLVALRLSDNKFTGRGGTDTGNRLFNTTRLD